MECARRAVSQKSSRTIRILFQSLFLWNVLVESYLRHKRLRRRMFQSLFLWNVLVEHERNIGPFAVICVSILVFMECARREHPASPHHELYGFQSLFLWNVLVEASPPYGQRPRDEFQSLFLWNVLVEMIVTFPFGTMIRVSILVFMECARRALLQKRAYPEHVSFNPCFYGMCS